MANIASPDLQTSTDPFEDFLSKTLNQVNPDPAFVGQLQKRLTKKADVELEKPQWMAISLVVGIGLFSGALLFWMILLIFKGIRALIK